MLGHFKVQYTSPRLVVNETVGIAGVLLWYITATNFTPITFRRKKASKRRRI